MSAELFGFCIDTLKFEDALKKAELLINTNVVSQVVTINPEMFSDAGINNDFADILRNAGMVIPDGIGVKIALKINGIESERIPGIDFAKKLLELSAENNWSVAIVGAKEDIIQKAVENIKNDIPELNITYDHNGYFDEDNAIYQDLIEKNPNLILVAMGSPRQEFFINNAKKVLNRGLMVGIGGSLDVWSGNVKRAPIFFQKTGLEWLYRTISQPERFKRIFPALPMFILKSIKYKFLK